MPSRVKLLRRVPGTQALYNYLGVCEVRGEGGALLTTLKAERQVHPIPFALPVGTVHVDFVCAGHAPIGRDLPPMHDGIRDFGVLTLEPDAGVRVRVLHLPREWSGHVRCSLEADDDTVGDVELDVSAGDAEALLPVPSGHTLSCLVESFDGRPFVLASRSPEFELRSGETRLFEVDVATLSTQTIRVVGPSPDLLPNLVIECSIAENRVGSPVQLDRDGRAVVRGLEVARLSFAVATCTGRYRLFQRTATTGPDLELEPSLPIVGLTLRGEDGTPVLFALGYQPRGPDLAYVGRRSLVQVADAAITATGTTLLAWNDATGSLRWPASAVVWRGDVGELDVHTAERRAGLVLTVTGDRPKEGRRFAVELLGAKGESAAVRESADNSFEFADLVPGDYGIRWRIGKDPGPQIVDATTLAPGPPSRLTASWPTLAPWQGEVANWRSIPAADRLPVVKVGVGGSVMIDDAGHFEVQILEGAAPPQTVRFAFSATWREGRVLAVDALAHRVLVEHPTDVRWVNLRVAPLAATGWVMLFRSGQDFGQTLDARSPQRILMPERGTLGGMLLEDDPGTSDRRVTAWVTIDGSKQEVQVDTTGGRWCDLRFERAGTCMVYEIRGPDGQPGWVSTMDRPGTRRLWIAPGASSLHVTLTPGGEQTFDVSTSEIVVR